MAQLLGIRIQNFKGLADVQLGRVDFDKGAPLDPMTCFIGRNGCGKSTLLDAFGFLADCMREGVEAACDKPHRGGFQRLRTQGSSAPIELTLYYREQPASRPIQYHLGIDLERGVPIVVSESLRQRRKGASSGRPLYFLRLNRGEGLAWAGQSLDSEEESPNRQPVKLADLSRPAITTLGQLREHERIVGLRQYIEGWYLSYFLPDAARLLPPSGAQKHLSRNGDNIGNYLQYLERTSRVELGRQLAKIAERIPGLRTIQTEETIDRRLLIRFEEHGYVDPFYQRDMSDGTLKVFAYLLMLADPEPHPFIGIEEPENGLYLDLQQVLAREFLHHVVQGANRPQLLITTHSPWFVDALRPKQVWKLDKDTAGHVTARRCADLPTISELVNQGVPLGSLWYSHHLEV